MAEQDDVTQGTIPPKVSPFAKPEKPAPITPAGAPGALRPITVRLKPVTSALEPAAPAPAVSANPKETSRVPVPEAVAEAAPAVIRPVTVRLRPVPQPHTATAPTYTPGATQAITQVDFSATSPIVPVASLQPQSPPTPGGNPLPSGPKPPSAGQMQAAKSKTSRISLDAAIGVTSAVDKEGPKTIRLKRPSDLATPSASPAVPHATASARKTSRIPDSALPAVERAEGGDSAGVTQKKTLKIRRPGIKADPTAEAGVDGFPDGIQLTPLGPADFGEKQESALFTTIAVFCASAAAVVLLLLTLCLGAHAMGPGAGKNSLASVRGPELPWPGRIAE